MKNLRIFGLGNSRPFASEIAKHLAKSLNRHHEERRPDGEAYTTSLDNVRGADVFVVTSLYGDETECVDQKLMKTLVFINTLRHASAERITLVAPYLCYARQDRKTESRAPIATQAVAMMLESVGMNRLLTMDVHNLGAEQNAFRVPIDNLEARKILADSIARDIRFPGHAITDCTDGYKRAFKVLTPDAGGTARTKLMQHSLSKRLGVQVDIVYADKTRKDSNNVIVNIVGDVRGANVVIIDDLISTGGTLAECQGAVEAAGGVLWGVAATHGLYVNGAPEKLAKIPRIYTTDTVFPPPRLAVTRTIKAVKLVTTAPMFAEAIRRIHSEGGSISQLLED